MPQEQTSSTFGGGSEPQVVEPDTSFSDDISMVETLQESLPKYQGINPYAFKKKLVENDEFFNRVTDEYAMVASPPQLKQVKQKDPEGYQTFVNNFKTNFKKDLVTSSYAGESAKDTLVNRTLSFRVEPQDVPASTYLEIVKSNPDEYKKFGLIGDNGNSLFSEIDEISFSKKVLSNPDLHNRIVQDRYNQFQDVLANSNNNPRLLDDKAKLTQAWVVYDNFGKEGLTQYMNSIQISNQEKSINERLEGASDADDYFRGAAVNGKNVSQLIQDFIVAGENPLTFQPVTPRDELTKEIPEDFNGYTMWGYDVSEDGYSLSERDPYEVSKEFLKKFSPDDYKKFQDVRNLRKDGEYSDEYLQLITGVYEQAFKNDSFSVQDLKDTLKVNGQHRTEDGRSIWRVDYNKLPPKARIAFDALRQYDREGEFVLQKLGSGQYDFRPQRREASQGYFDTIKNILFDTKEEMYQDENGDIKVREVAESGILATPWNTAMTSVLGGLDMINRFGAMPILDMAADFTGNESLQVLHEKMKTSTGVDLASGLSAETDGIIPNAVGEVAPFIEYMGSMFIGGGLALKGLKWGTKGYRYLTGMKRIGDISRMSKIAGGASRWSAIRQKLGQGFASKEPWTLAPKLYAGGAVVEATQPEETSIFTLVPEMLGYSPTSSVSKFYKDAGRPMQMLMDVAGSLAFDGLADTILASGKFAVAKVAQKAGKRTQFKGLKYIPENPNKKFGGFEVVDEPKFRTELQEFWRNATSDLDKLPIGDVGETMARGFTKGQNAKTLHDVARGYVDDSEFLMKDIRKDVENQIRYLNDELGDVPLKDNEVDDLVEAQYDIFMNNVADQTYGILRTSSPELPLKFAQVLDEQVPTVRQVKQNGIAVPASRIDHIRETSSSTSKFIAKDGKIYEVNPNYWTIDLAERIRTKSLAQTKEDVVRRKIDALGDVEDRADQAAKIRQRADEIIGTAVKTEDGNVGYVVDFDDNGFVVRGADGDVKRTSVLDELTDEEVRQKVIDATNSEMVRKRMMFGFQEPTIQTDIVPPSRRLSSANVPEEEQRLLSRIDEIEGRTGTLRERYKNLDEVILDETPDAPKVRASQRREITRDIKQLNKQKIQLQRELSEFYLKNPEVQGMRRIISEEINIQNKQRLTEQYTKRFKETSETTAKTINKQLNLPFC